MNAKDLWINLFDISLEKYSTEDCNIRSMAMLLHVFHLEFKKVSNYINNLEEKNEIQIKTIKNYEHEIKNCKCKIIKNRSPLKTVPLNNNVQISPKQNQSVEHIDDVFNVPINDVDFNISKENDASLLFVDDSFSTFAPSSSPTLNSRKSRSFRATTSRNQNLNNSSVIQGTPTLKVNKVKKYRQSKLPSSFCPTDKNNCDDTDATFCFRGQQKQNDIVNEGGDDIDDILDELNCVTPNKKKIKLNNSYDCPPRFDECPKIPCKREAVRKKSERLQLQGWECQDCEKYYMQLDLPEKELKKRMNMCSKHRDNFNPNRLTPEGFWNPDFTPTQNSFAFEL